jgi:hypothetical protein
MESILVIIVLGMAYGLLCEQHYRGLICGAKEGITCLCQDIAQGKIRVKCYATAEVTSMPTFKYADKVSTTMLSLHGSQYNMEVLDIIHQWPSLKMISIEDTNLPCDHRLVINIAAIDIQLFCFQRPSQNPTLPSVTPTDFQRPGQNPALSSVNPTDMSDAMKHSGQSTFDTGNGVALDNNGRAVTPVYRIDNDTKGNTLDTVKSGKTVIIGLSVGLSVAVVLVIGIFIAFGVIWWLKRVRVTGPMYFASPIYSDPSIPMDEFDNDL